jgi:hypothetical protein
MDDIPKKIAVEHKCHCCTTEKNIELCELEHCDYALCTSCKQKVFKKNNKCPCCRREITITIHQGSSGEDSSDEDSLDLETLTESIGKCEKKIFCIFNFLYQITRFLVLIFILLCLGRLFTIITKFGPSNNFWFTDFEKPILMFLIFSTIGSVFIFFVFFLCLCFCKTINKSLQNVL